MNSIFFLGGQFAPDGGGQFESDCIGLLNHLRGGQFDRCLQFSEDCCEFNYGVYLYSNNKYFMQYDNHLISLELELMEKKYPDFFKEKKLTEFVNFRTSTTNGVFIGEYAIGLTDTTLPDNIFDDLKKAIAERMDNYNG